jgi:outer membrane protein TolC
MWQHGFEEGQHHEDQDGELNALEEQPDERIPQKVLLRRPTVLLAGWLIHAATLSP